jgi:hypothetical protein
VLFTGIAGPPSSGAFAEPIVLFNFRMDIGTGVFLLLAGVDHGATLLPPLWKYYTGQVARGVNPIRWIEYSISSSIMLVLISLTVGIRDINALIIGFGCNSAMILFGLVQEWENDPSERRGRKVTWWPFIFGSVIGIVPWIALSTTLGLSQTNCLNEVYNSTFTVYDPTTTPMMANATMSDIECIPGFVFGIYFSLLILFFTVRMSAVLLMFVSCTNILIISLPSTCCCNISRWGRGSARTFLNVYICG